MTISEYQELAMRTNDGLCNLRVLQEVVRFNDLLEIYDHEEAVAINGYDPGELLNGALGLPGEAGEVADVVKKLLFHGHDFNIQELVKELGDVCWYLALISHACGISIEQIMEENVEKLRKRYPDGFSVEKSLHRAECDI